MRERFAKWLVAFTTLTLVIAALGFAVLQYMVRAPAIDNGPHADSAPPANAESHAAGAAVYAEQGCAQCHAIGGAGNLRNPLDGLGSRHTPAEIRNFIAPTEAVRKLLPPRIYEMKQKYHDLPKAQMDALVDYLGSV